MKLDLVQSCGIEIKYRPWLSHVGLWIRMFEIIFRLFDSSAVIFNGCVTLYVNSLSERILSKSDSRKDRKRQVPVTFQCLHFVGPLLNWYSFQSDSNGTDCINLHKFA